MEKSKVGTKQARSGTWVRGRKVASVAHGMTLVQVGGQAKGIVPLKGQTKALVPKAAKALNRPGIKREVVFRGPDIYSYSINPQDPTQFIREDAKGSRIVGYMSKGKFLATKMQAPSLPVKAQLSKKRVSKAQAITT